MAQYRLMKCPLCQSVTWILTSDKFREFFHCEVCNLIFVPPRFFLPKEDEIQRYLEHENSIDNLGYVQMFQKKINLLKLYCPNAKKILDFGCGYEPVLQELLIKEGYDSEVYDIHFFPALPKKNFFDIVISTETFEHFQNPQKELNLIYGLLKPKSFCAIMTKLYPQQNKEPNLEEFNNWYYKRDLTHICFYSLQTFQWIANNLNMEIIYNNGQDFVILQKA